jgi:hypothetical protein
MMTSNKLIKVTEIEIFTEIAEAINTSILVFLGVIYEFQLGPKSILPFTPPTIFNLYLGDATPKVHF